MSKLILLYISYFKAIFIFTEKYDGVGDHHSHLSSSEIWSKVSVWIADMSSIMRNRANFLIVNLYLSVQQL
jgi:hypothetical protein